MRFPHAIHFGLSLIRSSLFFGLAGVSIASLIAGPEFSASLGPSENQSVQPISQIDAATADSPKGSKAELLTELDRLMAKVGDSPGLDVAPQVRDRIQELRLALYPPQPPQQMDYIGEIEIPADASPAEEEFLVARAEAFNAFAQVHNRHLDSAAEARNEAFAELHQRRANENQRMQELARQASDQQTGTAAIEVPSAPDIPANASPALRDFLTARHDLMIELARQSPANSKADQMTKPAVQARIEAVRQRAVQLSSESQTRFRTAQ